MLCTNIFLPPMSFERIYLQDFVFCGQWASRTSDCIMLIDDSYYKNVLLLMQAVPASVECIKHFRKVSLVYLKRSDDRNNRCSYNWSIEIRRECSINLIQLVSFMFLIIYCPCTMRSAFGEWLRGQSFIRRTEKQYRAELKAYLEILANDNLDIKFPPILASHLLQAGGTKFLIIMWKISEISLRAYVQRNCEYLIQKLD